jgi:hypothetical protein
VIVINLLTAQPSWWWTAGIVIWLVFRPLEGKGYR